MKKALIGRKIGMTQIFDEKGNVIPVTAIEVGPCTVTQIKTVEQDGYQAVQLGFGEVKETKLNKPELGKFRKGKLAPKKHLREFRLDSGMILSPFTEVALIFKLSSAKLPDPPPPPLADRKYPR